MNAVRALLFDKDGTLVDFDRTWGPAAREVMRRLAAGDAETLARLHEVSHFVPEEDRFRGTSPLVAGSSAQYGPLWAHVLARPSTPEFFAEVDALFGEEGLRSLTAIGRPHESLARLAGAGFPLGIATNDNEANARLQAEHLGILPLMAGIYGYDSGHGPKPQPGMIEAFARQAGVPVATVALVGDTHHDFATARAAGALFVLVRSGPERIDAFADQADLVVDDVAELVDRLLGREAVPA